MTLSLPQGLSPWLLALPLLAPGLASAGPARPGLLALASANEAGQAVGGLPAGGALCALSADGRRVAFTTAAGLDATDTNNKLDAYVKDLDTGRVQRVSGGAASPGPTSPGTRCHDMTPDGRFVVVSSFNAVFVRDLLTGRLKQLSPPAATLPNVAGFLGGSISDDGQRVAFMTSPEKYFDLDLQYFVNLIPARAMVFDRAVGQAVTLLTDDGITAHGEVSFPGGGWPQMSPDGRRLIFQTNHDALVPGDTNGQWDVVVQDLLTGETAIASRNNQGAPTHPIYSGQAFYGLPRWAAADSIVFHSEVPTTLGAPGLYLKHLGSGELSLVLPDSQGFSGRLSPDMSRLAYSQALALGQQRVVERDLRTGLETLVSSSSKGQPANGSSNVPVYSGDGRAIGFQSIASNLVPGGTPFGELQLYVKRVAAKP